MGHPELHSECDINKLEPLLPRDVVDDLLSKYVKTFTVRVTHTQGDGNECLSCLSFSLYTPDGIPFGTAGGIPT